MGDKIVQKGFFVISDCLQHDAIAVYLFSVKRNAAKASLVLPPERQILTALQLYNWLKNDGNYKDVHFAYSPESEYMKNSRHLNSRFNITDRVKHLRKQHYIRPLKNKSTVVCKHHSSMR